MRTCQVFIIHDGEENGDMDELMSQVDILTADASENEESDEEEEPPAQRRRLTIDEYNMLSPDSRADQRAGLRRLCRCPRPLSSLCLLMCETLRRGDTRYSRYYSASWHGTAASLLIYSLVQSLNSELVVICGSAPMPMLFLAVLVVAQRSRMSCCGLPSWD